MAGLVEGLVRRFTLAPNVKTVVLGDSKGHLLVHFSDGVRLATYRLDRSLVDTAMGGEAARLDEVTGLLSRHLMADLLGHEEARPPRTTELAREQAGKASAGQAEKPPASQPDRLASPLGRVSPSILANFSLLRVHRWAKMGATGWRESAI
ncbi:MAG: hypothetical protein QME77_06890 [bacterium]|nr:hypothetical protein [bacterium]